MNVVIDVIRAFTFCHVALAGGARRVVLARTVKEARSLRARFPGALLAGEVRALPVPGFDLGNSPAEVAAARVRNCDIILKTTNGTEATLNSAACAKVYVAGFCNADATAQRLRAFAAEAAPVQLVASHPTSDEDVACAEYVRDRVLGAAPPISPERVAQRIRGSDAARKFLDGSEPRLSPRDIEHCADRPARQLVLSVTFEHEAIIEIESRHDIVH